MPSNGQYAFTRPVRDSSILHDYKYCVNNEQYYKSCLQVCVLSGATSTTESVTPARDREVVVSDTYVYSSDSACRGCGMSPAELSEQRCRSHRCHEP